MDDLKFKVINFVKKQGSNNVQEEVDNSELIRNSAFIRQKKFEEPIEEVEDEVVLRQLPVYFYNSSPEFDITLFIFKELPPKIKCPEIKIQLRTLYRQHGLVSKKTLQRILEKESKCQEELERVNKIQSNLRTALEVCRGSRLDLNNAKSKFTHVGLGVLKHVEQKQRINLLLSNLKTIRTLQRSEERLQKLLKEKDFPGAIRLLLESQAMSSTLKHFNCIAQLSWKHQEILESTESQLDVVLSEMCSNFEEVTYSNLHEAFQLLDKTQAVMDQLLMHFTLQLHSCPFQVVHEYASSSSTKNFQQLCKLVPSKECVQCLQEMCQKIWPILNSYYKIFAWHQQQEKDVQVKPEMTGREIEKSLNKQYVKQKLENGQIRIWNDVQSKISAFVMAQDFSGCKFEDLIHMLAILHRLVEIGEEFCGSRSEEISKCARQQTISYFQCYHAARLEELRIFLENEVWTPCPMRNGFNLTHLQEFKSLRNAIENYRKPKKNESDGSIKANESETRSNLSTEGSSYFNSNYFTRYSDDSSPFLSNLDETYQEDILDNIGEDLSGYYSVSSEDSDSEELKKAFVEETPPTAGHKKKSRDKRDSKSKQLGAIVTNTTLTVLRHCGKYLQMCRLLKPIAFDVIMCMTQLFEYYLYNVFHFFTNDLPVQSPKLVSFKLKAVLKGIEDHLILNSNDETKDDNHRRIVASRLSELVNLESKDTLHGLSDRVVGVESLIFLGNQFEYIQPYVLHLVPEEKRHFVEQFYSQTIACVSDLRKPAYMCVSAHVVDMRQTVKEMTTVNFDLKDITSEHSRYIDKIFRDMQIFSMKLEELELDIPHETEVVLWENVMNVVNNILVDGFSSSRKCSNSGRALMLLDYTQLISKVQKLTPLKQVPNKEYVETYVKAFYFQENMLEEWIFQHREYTPKQLESLVHCACQNNKKTKQRLLQMLEVAR